MSDPVVSAENTDQAALPVDNQVTDSLTSDAVFGDPPDTSQDASATDGTAIDGAPEQYAEFVAAEGQSFDPMVIGKFSEVAKDLNLSQDKAQKFLDTMAPVLAEQNHAKLVEAQQGWKTQSTSDQEFGGNDFQKNMVVANKGLDKFATPELKQLLQQSGLKNHPEIIRVFYRAGKAISEDTFVGGQAPSGKAKSATDVLYDNSSK